MKKEDTYAKLKDFLRLQAQKANLLEETVLIEGRILTNEEAIGTPHRQDYPLLKGKEKLLQAEFKGALGQAFTDSPGSFQGTLSQLLAQRITTNFEKASFIAVLNAVMRYLELAEGTIHCKDEEPIECAEKMVAYIKDNYGRPKIAMIGLQPAILEECRKEFHIRIVDMDPDNIGHEKCGVLVEDAETQTEELLNWCELALITGSTVANGTIINFLYINKPTIYFGTTIAGAAPILGVKRFCKCSK